MYKGTYLYNSIYENIQYILLHRYNVYNNLKDPLLRTFTIFKFDTYIKLVFICCMLQIPALTTILVNYNLYRLLLCNTWILLFLYFSGIFSPDVISTDIFVSDNFFSGIISYYRFSQGFYV